MRRPHTPMFALLIMAAMVLIAGCSDSNTSNTSVPASSTVAPTSTSTAVLPVDTIVAPPAPQVPPGGLVVANPDGAFLLDNDFLFQLFAGPVELAVDDGAGGLVFQQFSDVGLREPRTTIIYYLPADSFEAQELLVPTGDQYLKLWDVQDGVVWYTRTEGDNPDNSRETLRSYDLATRTVDQFAITGGWESGSIQISVGGSSVAAYWSAEAASGFTFYSESGGTIGFGGDPYGPDLFCGDGELYDTSGDLVRTGCFEYAELSDDGRLAYLEREFDGVETRYVLVIVDRDSGEKLFRQDLNRPDQGWAPKTIDLMDSQAIVNRAESGVFGAPFVEALLIDLNSGTVAELSLQGHARFLRGPMAVD